MNALAAGIGIVAAAAFLGRRRSRSGLQGFFRRVDGINDNGMTVAVDDGHGKVLVFTNTGSPILHPDEAREVAEWLTEAADLAEDTKDHPTYRQR